MISRRSFLARAAAIAVVSTGGYEVLTERDNLTVTNTDIQLPRWPTSANGLTIGVLSDFHVDYDHALHRTQRAASMLLAQNTDLVLICGDYISSHFTKKYLAPTIDALAPLTAAPKGAYAIMGNHDCWSNCHDIATKLLTRAGFDVLNNRSVPIAGLEDAYLVGLDDAWCGKMDVAKALGELPPHSRKIVAVHEPDFADAIGKGFDLQISGHSHGGQIRVPGLPVIHAPLYGAKYPEGLQMAENHLVYTTRGIGMVGPQIRTFCSPEVTVLTLRTT